jgi:hypothetical protein
VCAMGAGLRPLGKPSEQPPYPTVRARRISIQTTCDSYVPNVSIGGSNLGKGFPRFRAQNSFRRGLIRSLGSISLWTRLSGRVLDLDICKAYANHYVV